MGNLCSGGASEEEKRKQPAPRVPLGQLDTDSEEEADVVEDLPEPGPEYLARPGRQSVSAEVYGEFNKKRAFVAPVNPKSAEAKEAIRTRLGESFLFSALGRKELEVIVDAVVEAKFEAGAIIIQQGADGDRLYLLDEGSAEVSKNDAVLVTLGAGDSFGELALMYNAPRAATVKATTAVRAWSLDRETFTHVVRDAAARKRELYQDILGKVKLLTTLDAYERAKIADALREREVAKGAQIITEGDAGDEMYFLIEGKAEAFKQGQLVKEYETGDYFGELALLKNQPRAATVTAKTDVKLACLGRKSYQRLMGPLETIMQRNVKEYRAILKNLGLDTQLVE